VQEIGGEMQSLKRGMNAQQQRLDAQQREISELKERMAQVGSLREEVSSWAHPRGWGDASAAA
jgi:archaellum component FlaC